MVFKPGIKGSDGLIYFYGTYLTEDKKCKLCGEIMLANEPRDVYVHYQDKWHAHPECVELRPESEQEE